VVAVQATAELPEHCPNKVKGKKEYGHQNDDDRDKGEYPDQGDQAVNPHLPEDQIEYVRRIAGQNDGE